LLVLSHIFARLERGERDLPLEGSEVAVFLLVLIACILEIMLVDLLREKEVRYKIVGDCRIDVEAEGNGGE